MKKLMLVLALLSMIVLIEVGCSHKELGDSCDNGNGVTGDNGECYSCPNGGTPATTPSGNCSNAVHGVSCCVDGSM